MLRLDMKLWTASALYRFKVLLENTEVDCSLLQEEWDDMVDYARQYPRKSIKLCGRSSSS